MKSQTIGSTRERPAKQYKFTPQYTNPDRKGHIYKQTEADLLEHSSPYYDLSLTQSDLEDKPYFLSKIQNFVRMGSRVCCLALGAHKVYAGTVKGDVYAINGRDGSFLEGLEWKQPNTPIEGIMYDYEGKVIYATEYNLVILDKEFKKLLKEIRSFEPLRKQKTIKEINREKFEF